MRTQSAALLLAVASAACSHAKRAPPPAPLPLAPPLVAFEAVKVEGLGFAGARLEFRGRVENPNATPMSIVRVDYGLDLEGTRAAQGGSDLSLALPAADPAAGPGLGSVPLPVQVRYAAVPGVAKVLALEREAAYALGTRRRSRARFAGSAEPAYPAGLPQTVRRSQVSPSPARLA